MHCVLPALGFFCFVLSYLEHEEYLMFLTCCVGLTFKITDMLGNYDVYRYKVDRIFFFFKGALGKLCKYLI